MDPLNSTIIENFLSNIQTDKQVEFNFDCLVIKDDLNVDDQSINK
jgi:hypothetical protein